MRHFILLLTIFFIAGTAQAQNENVISINASAEVLVPADQITFHINLNAGAETPQEAYDLHKEREKALVEALKSNDIAEENIDFEPISISKTYNNQYPREEGEVHVRTSQSVILKLEDFDTYEEIQIVLIENGFDEFSGNFSSSELDQGRDEALKKALDSAREKADIIAGETGLTITGIKNVTYSYNQGPPRPMMMEARAKSSDSLMEFDQTVSVSATVSVTYNFN